MSDFGDKLKAIGGFMLDAAESLKDKIDHYTFKTLVDCLKSDDLEAVNTAIEQLTNEKNPIGIPPLFFVYKEHNSTTIRQRAKRAIEQIGDWRRVEELTRGKSTEDGVKALINEYGHYRHPGDREEGTSSN